MGAIAGNGLQIIEEIENTLTAKKYVGILEENVREAFNQYGSTLNYFMEDNDPKHGGPRGALLTREWFGDIADIIRLEWPTNSPDLNPIENAWHELQKKVNVKHITKKRDLFDTAQKL